MKLPLCKEENGSKAHFWRNDLGREEQDREEKDEL